MLKTLRSTAHSGILLALVHAASIGIQAAEPALPAAADGAATAAPPASNPLLEPPPVGTLPEITLPPSAPATPTTNVTINLINALVKKGILDGQEAQQMIMQAEQEAAYAKAQLEEVKAPPVNDGDVRVTYIPESVKNQMRELIKQDVMAQAREEKWAAPGIMAEWTERIKWFGDFRFRSRFDIFPEDNDNTGAFPNFNAINTGAPFDVAGTVFSPQYNVDQDRHKFQIRARLGVDVNLGEGWYGGIRFGTGETNTPVTQNQGLGLAGQGQGGNFSKYAMWIDRAFIGYERGSELGSNINLMFGRFDNPFFSTEMIWNENIGFDGIGIKGRVVINDHIAIFGAGGAFPVFNTDFNFATNQPAKFKSTDKYLYGSQLGVDFKIDEHINGRIAGAYYHFDGVEGKLSSPYIPLTAQDAGDTDNTRPSFAQKGNTYRALRNIVPSVINNFGTSMQYQYFGLATPFHEAALTGEINFTHWEPYQLTLSGEYVKNTAFDKEAIDEVAVNNRGADPAKGQIGVFDGSDTAWMLKMEFGKKKFEKLGDWSAWIDYRYVGSDAVVDAFNDNDFGGGGTNVEGFTIGAQMALSKRVKLGARWMSATEITGPPLKTDIFMLDISAKF